MTDKPEYTPSCCNQEAKWVNPTLNLAYFYCTKCKKEVPTCTPNAWGGYAPVVVNFTKSANGTVSRTIMSQSSTLPVPPAQAAPKFKIGDKVWWLNLNLNKTEGIVVNITHSGWNGKREYVVRYEDLNGYVLIQAFYEYNLNQSP